MWNVSGVSFVSPLTVPTYSHQFPPATRVHTRARVLVLTNSYLWGMALPARVISKRRRMYTVPQLAERLGVDPSTVYRLEADPLADLLTRYLAAVGYQAAFYPRRKGQG